MISIKRILGSSAFIVSFGFFVVLIVLFTLFFGSWESFILFTSWTARQNLKLWSNFVRTDSVDTPIVGTVLAQVKVWQGSFYGDTSWSSAMRIRDRTQSLIETDILQLLSEAQDPEQVLQMHLGQMKQTLQDIQANVTALNDLSTQKREASQECYVSKREGDRIFFEWATSHDPQQTQAWLDQSLEFAPCYITNRIESNAYAFMAQRVLAYQTLLIRRSNTLTTYADILVSAYPLLYGDVAEQLVQVKRQLETVNTTDFSLFSEYFMYWVPPPDALPSLQNVLFRENDLEVPTYIDPFDKLND